MKIQLENCTSKNRWYYLNKMNTLILLHCDFEYIARITQRSTRIIIRSNLFIDSVLHEYESRYKINFTHVHLAKDFQFVFDVKSDARQKRIISKPIWFFFRERGSIQCPVDERNEITDTTIANNRFEHVHSRTISFTLLTSVIVTLARSTWMRRARLFPAVCQYVKVVCAKDARDWNDRSRFALAISTIFFFLLTFININGVLLNFLRLRIKKRTSNTAWCQVSMKIEMKDTKHVWSLQFYSDSFPTLFSKTTERFRKYVLLHTCYVLYVYILS